MLRVGTKLRSVVCSTQVIVVRVANPDAKLSCGGQVMVEAGDSDVLTGVPSPGLAGGTLLGKRYVHHTGLEVVCIRSGAGSVSIGDDVLQVKVAEQLPSSD